MEKGTYLEKCFFIDSISFYFLIDCKRQVGLVWANSRLFLLILPLFSIQWLPSNRPQDVSFWSHLPLFLLGVVVFLPDFHWFSKVCKDTWTIDLAQEALRFLMAFTAEEGHLEDAEAHAMRLLDSSGPEKETGWVQTKTHQKRRGKPNHSLKITLLR